MEETKELVQEAIDQMPLIISTALFCLVKAEHLNHKGNKFELAKLLDHWRKENSSRKKHALNERYSPQQTEIIKKLEWIVPHEQKAVANYSQNSQNIVSEDGHEDCCENTYKKPKSISKTAIKTSKHYNKTQETSLELMNINFGRNIRYIEDLLTLYDEIERKSPYFPTILHEALFDEAEHASQLGNSKVAGTIKNVQHSEDSGFYSENVSEESFVNIQADHAMVENETQGSTNSNSIIIDSIVNILDNIKTEIDVNRKEVVQNWRGSLVEHAWSVMCRCSVKGVECEKIILDFVVDLLQDIWRDRQMTQHTKWSQQISIINQLLTTTPICLEVLFFTTEVLDNVTTAIRKGCCTSLMIVKVALFLDLFPIMARTLNEHLKPFYKKQLDKNINVTKLWQDKFSSVTSDNYHRDVIQGIKTEIIPKLVRFFTSTINKEPLISLAAKEALEELNNLSNESHTSQDSLMDMY